MKSIKLTLAEIFEKVVRFTAYENDSTIAHIEDGSRYVIEQSIDFIMQCYGYWLKEQGEPKIAIVSVPLPDVEKKPEMSKTDYSRKLLKETAEAIATALGVAPKNPKFFDELSDYQIEQLWAEAKYMYELEKECTSPKVQ